MNKKYIVKNCPNLQESYYANGYISKNECSLEIDDKQCADCTDCLIKRIYEDVKTVYRTPEYFETIKDKEQYLIESAWHNVAHMVISKLEIEEVE